MYANLTEEKRRKALQERRLARERKIEESITIWEREIVPDWTVVHRNPALKKLWWKGIPTKLRASMWQNAVGNALVLSKGIVFDAERILCRPMLIVNRCVQDLPVASKTRARVGFVPDHCARSARRRY